jgi:DNA-binding GntR family transcriptional regulator
MTSADWVGSSIPYISPTEAGRGDAWRTEAAALGGKGTQKLAEVGERVPPPAVQDALQLSAGELAVVRRRIMYLDDAAVELTDSYYPQRIAAGTDLAMPRKIRGGAVRLLGDLGYAAAIVNEQIEARPPSANEREELTLSADEWVLVLTRLIADASGQPIEASVMAMPAKQRRLHYSMKVD